MNLATNFIHYLLTRLNRIGEFLPQLALRLFLAWEFGESGWGELTSTN
jgi:uncharacterized membrane protein YphA (DoxX/SURF4 family)